MPSVSGRPPGASELDMMQIQPRMRLERAAVRATAHSQGTDNPCSVVTSSSCRLRQIETVINDRRGELGVVVRACRQRSQFQASLQIAVRVPVILLEGAAGKSRYF